MTNEQNKIINDTVPILKENGVLLTKYFYNRMLTAHPELKNMFNMGNQKSGKQQTALAMAVLAYAENIANPSVLMPVVDRIGQKHISLDIRPEHYRIVGNHLIASIKEVLGEGATADIIDAWTAAYNQLANLMSGHEAKLYDKQTALENGWTGWRPFYVKSKKTESSEITSFYLYPTDGGKVVRHLAGQFISLRIFLPQLGLKQSRQYSISSVPGNDFYRISVKRELGLDIDTNGMISNHLHDLVDAGEVIDITAPAGNFFLPHNIDVPVTLISGGVGLTPLMSMLNTLVENNHQHTVTWLHGCRNSDVHAFREELEIIKRENANIKHHVFYNELSPEHRIAGMLEGHLDIAKVPGLNHDSNGRYYICGPSLFIRKQFTDLIAAGINRKNIFFEEFGPQLIELN